MGKIPKKFAPVLFAFFMAIIFPFIITFFIVLINVGFTNDFFLRWMKSFGITFIIAFPTIIGLSPMIRKIVEKITA